MDRIPVIRFFGFENEHSRIAVERALLDSIHIFPPWAYELFVTMYQGSPEPKEGEPETMASTTTEFGYRSVYIFIYPTFLSVSVEQQARVMRHEVVHSLTGDLVAWVKKRLISTVQDEVLKKELDHILTEKLEGVNQDICRCLESQH